MDFSQAFTVLAGWVVFSVPASLLIGAFIGRGAQLPQEVRVRAFDKAA